MKVSAQLVTEPMEVLRHAGYARQSQHHRSNRPDSVSDDGKGLAAVEQGNGKGVALDPTIVTAT